MSGQTKVVIIGCCLIMLILCPLVIAIAIRGEKRLIKEKFIKGFFFWPDVYGDKVPVVARRYKIMTITFAASMLLFTLYCAVTLFLKYS